MVKGVCIVALLPDVDIAIRLSYSDTIIYEIFTRSAFRHLPIPVG